MAQRAAAEAVGGSWCARGYNCGGSRRTEAVHGRSSGKTSLARDCGGGDKLQRLTKRPAVDTRWLKVEVTRRCGRARSGSTVRSAGLRARLEWFDGSGGAEAWLRQQVGKKAISRRALLVVAAQGAAGSTCDNGGLRSWPLQRVEETLGSRDQAARGGTRRSRHKTDPSESRRSRFEVRLRPRSGGSKMMPAR